MLVITRRDNERVTLPLTRETLQQLLRDYPSGTEIVLCPRSDGNKTLLGIKAPNAVAIYRTELLEKKELQTR